MILKEPDYLQSQLIQRKIHHAVVMVVTLGGMIGNLCKHRLGQPYRGNHRALHALPDPIGYENVFRCDLSEFRNPCQIGTLPVSET